MSNAMNEIKLDNVPSMTPGKLVKTLAMAYGAVIDSGRPLTTVPSVMLWGPPGVGKSQAVRQLAHEIETRTGKRTAITDVRLLLFNPVDLRGIPTANADKTLAIWLKPQIFQMDDSADLVNILLLDEISAAPQSVQAAAYQITLDRAVGEHRLPKNCIVIAAGNRTTDRSVAFKMPKALANRLLHIEVREDFDAWREWAVRAGVNENVIGFLSFRPNRLMGFDSASSDLAFPTPRSWEMVSELLNGVCDDVDKMRSLIAGLVGSGVAAEMCAWARVRKDLPRIEDVFDGRAPAPPRSADALYALVSSMTTYARSHKDDMRRIANSIRYAEQLPPDFSVVYLKDLMCLEPDYRERLLSIPEFSRCLQKKGVLVNAAF